MAWKAVGRRAVVIRLATAVLASVMGLAGLPPLAFAQGEAPKDPTAMSVLAQMSGVTGWSRLNAPADIVATGTVTHYRDGGEHAGKSWLEWLASLRFLPLLLSALVALAVLLWQVRQWRLTFYTRDWTNLIKFLHANAEYMNPEKTRNYKEEFKGPDAIKYELVARLCIAYLDDMYFIGPKRIVRTWMKESMKGSVKLLCGRHRAWMEDNKQSYDKSFYDLIMQELGPKDDKKILPAQ